MIKKVKTSEFWENMRKNPAYTKMIDETKETYKRNKTEEIPEITFSMRSDFHKNGDRTSFEIPYFRRRNYLSSAAILTLLYPEESHYAEEVNNLIWAICGEYSWVVTAHSNNTLEWDFSYIDLFCAETGFMIAEICDVLGDKISPLVRRRAEYELHRRIIEPFENNTLKWEDGGSNWNAVCGGGIAGVLYYLEPELFEKYIPRFNFAMKRFFVSYFEDGTCIEGPSYWKYGMSYFAWYADMLYEFTNGEQDLLKEEKAQKMAGYMQRSFMLGDSIVSVSDSPRNIKSTIGLQYYLNSRLPNTVDLLPERLMSLTGPNLFWVHYIRAFEYFDPKKTVTEIPLKDYYLDSAGQVILNREKYSFAIKSGHNAEQHNHNDVGSFIFGTKNGQIFCDLGAGKYDAEYFGNETRYKILCCSSRGHNVPIIAEKEQKAGREHKGTLTYEDGIIKVDYASAYDIESLTSLIRTVIPKENGITLCDEFDSDGIFSERLVSIIKPKISDGEVCVDNVVVKYNSDNYTVTVSQEEHRLHGNNNNNTETVYCIDFILKKGIKKAVLEITVI